MDRDEGGSWLLSVLSALVLTIVGIFGLVLVLFFAIDSACVSQANEWLRVYPGTQQEALRYSFLRPYGSGLTQATYTTDAPPALVRRWYTLTTRQAEDAAIWRQLVLTAWWIEPRAGGTTTIQIQTSCGG